MHFIFRTALINTTKAWVVPSKSVQNLNTAKPNFLYKRSFKSLLLLGFFSSVMMSAHAAPTGGQVTAGAGSVSQSGSTTTISQQSQHLSMNWDKFNIAPKETVNFNQPNRDAIAVNRVLGSRQASQIQGHLNANGQVWLINPNGVVFSKGSVVNVGGLIASTLDIADSELKKAEREFSGSGTGSIINKGKIQTSKGGYVALLGNTVSNQGSIITPQGTTALAAGSQFTVTFADHQLTAIRVDKSTLNNLAENKQIIRANGGKVIMTAGARDSLLSSAVNNTGIIEAQTVRNHKGSILLLGGMTAGTTSVSGELNASAPRGGSGGEIDTSAAHVKIAPEVKITTASSNGTSGTWTIDPQDYTIAASGGDIIGSQVSTLLGTNNIIISSDQGQTAGTGNINVNNAITWSNTNSLTLNAVGNVIFNTGGTISNTGGGTLNVRADVNGTGVGTITLNTGSSVNVSGAGGQVNFYYNAPTNATSFLPSNFTGVTVSGGSIFTPYMMVYTQPQFSKIPTSPNNSTQYNYALGANINMTGVTGFNPITNSSSGGSLDGQNFTVSNLTISRPGVTNVGLFSTINNSATVKNITLSNINVTGGANVGALAGTNVGKISNITVSGTITASGNNVGGMLGQANANSSGTNLNSSVNVIATTTNSGNAYVGGLIGNIQGGTYTYATVTGNVTVGAHDQGVGGFAGYSNGTVTNASATGTLTTPFGGHVGGFIGVMDTASVTQYANATANIAAGDFSYDYNAGFVGQNGGSIDSCFSTGSLNLQQSWESGGFVGYNTGPISNSYATGNFIDTPGPVPGGSGSSTAVHYSGGFVGWNAGGALTNVYATGNVTINANPLSNNGSQSVGGLVGYLQGGSITHSYATGNVSSVSPLYLGGLVGYSQVPMTYVYATGNVTATITPAGSGFGPGSAPSNVGGLVGQFAGSTLSQGYSVGNVSAVTGSTNVGGLIGLGGGTITGRSFWDTTTSGQATSAGGANVVGMATADMQTLANFTSATPANGNVNPNWNFTPATPLIWKMGTGSYLYPVFNTPNAPTPPPPQPTPPVLYYPVTIPNLQANNKVYDGTTAAMVSGTLSGVLPSDTATISSFTGTFANKNVGNNKPVTLTNPTLSGANANKYLLVPINSYNTQANITPLPITVTASALNKVYDGTTTATTTLASTGVIAGDTVTFASTASNFATKNVGTAIPVTVTGITASGADSANYTVNTTAVTAANISQLSITLTGTGVNKVYDGTTTAQVNLTGTGVAPGDNVQFTAANANFNDKNVGTNKPITASGFSATGADAGNYSITTTSLNTTANITPLAITVGASALNKVYDGTTAAQTTLSSAGVIAGDAITFTSGPGTFDTKNVGNNKTVSVAGITATGGDAGNYTINNTTATTQASITPLAIVLTATGMNRVYNGTNAAQVTLASTGVIPGDTVQFQAGNATFDTKNVGNNKPISAGGFSATGADAGNYSFINTTASAVGNVTPLPITVAAAGSNKVYDGTTTAQATLSSTGVIPGDSLSFTSTGANFADKNVGTNKPITVNGISATGADQGNYTISNPSANTTANITPLQIQVTATAMDKTYDRTTPAQVTLASTGVIPGDTVNFTNTSANFDTKNAGTNKVVTVNGVMAAGADSGNYTIAAPTITTLGNINPLGITATATTMNKVYDGTTNATVTASSAGVLAGDSVTFTPGSASFDTKNVGNNKPVTINGVTTGGTDGANYFIQNPTITSQGNITPKPITIAATGMEKTYDGTTTAQVTLASTGVVSGDNINFSPASANFNDKNAGVNKPITVNGIASTGNDAGNYTIVNPNTTATGTINPLTLTATPNIPPKVYDGTTTATVSSITPNNVIPGDTVNLTSTGANFDNKNAGPNKVVTVNGVAVGGPDSGNYTVPSTLTGQGAITPKPITVAGTGSDKIYDGTTGAMVTITSPGIVPGDTVQLTPGAANFNNKNVGPNKPITVTGVTSGGPDGGNYTVTNPALTSSASITPRTITVGATGDDKIFDGTNNVSVNLTSPGIVPGDAVNLTNGSATSTSPGPGLNIPVDVAGIGINGADAGNYIVGNSTTTTTVNVFPSVIPTPPQFNFYINNQVPLQSIIAALQKPLTGALIGNPWWNDNDARKDRIYEPLNLFVRGRGVRLPSRNRVLGEII